MTKSWEVSGPVSSLNRITPGGNYGWPNCEGPCNNPAFINPVRSWPTSQATPSGLTYYKNSLFMASRDEAADPNNVLWVVTPGGIHNADGL